MSELNVAENQDKFYFVDFDEVVSGVEFKSSFVLLTDQEKDIDDAIVQVLLTWRGEGEETQEGHWQYGDVDVTGWNVVSITAEQLSVLMPLMSSIDLRSKGNSVNEQ